MLAKAAVLEADESSLSSAAIFGTFIDALSTV
jgi:hypothetical protein